MCDICFNLSGPFIFILAFSGISITMIGRFSILTLKERLGRDFFKIFSQVHNSFPCDYNKQMNIDTQMKLYKILYFNKNNIRNILGIKQNIFVLLINLNLVLFFLILPLCVMSCLLR